MADAGPVTKVNHFYNGSVSIEVISQFLGKAPVRPFPGPSWFPARVRKVSDSPPAPFRSVLLAGQGRDGAPPFVPAVSGYDQA